MFVQEVAPIEKKVVAEAEVVAQLVPQALLLEVTEAEYLNLPALFLQL